MTLNRDQELTSNEMGKITATPNNSKPSKQNEEEEKEEAGFSL